jgi:arylsulfatase A-like enzyme
MVLVVAVALSASACGRTVEPSAEGRWNVVVLMVDTLRADRMSLYGATRPTTPGLERLARESVVFDHARSQAGCTFPSVASLLTSRHANRFMVRIEENGMAVPDGVPYLPDVLHRHGYATAAVSASLIVRDTPSKINRQGGYGRGFDRFDESCLERPASCVQERAETILETLPEPFFLYLHYLDPHAPYRPPPWHERQFATRRSARRWVRRGEPGRIFRRLYEGDTSVDLRPEDLGHFSDLYDEEVRFLDDQLAAFVDRLRRRGLLSRTLLVLVADHGEELMDHGDFGHCRDLAYETLLHTPLVIRLPDGLADGGATGRRSAPVDNLDLVPTLLDYLGIDAGATGAGGRSPFDGRSLRPLIEGTGRSTRRVHFALQGTVRTVTDGRFKLLVDQETGTESLYDLEADPRETRDLLAAAGGHLQVVERLRRALARWVEAIEGDDAAESVRRAHEHEQRLESLGYL